MLRIYCKILFLIVKERTTCHTLGGAMFVKVILRIIRLLIITTLNDHLDVRTSYAQKRNTEVSGIIQSIVPWKPQQ